MSYPPVTSPDGSVDHTELCECGERRWKHKHDASCQNLACTCNRFRSLRKL